MRRFFDQPEGTKFGVLTFVPDTEQDAQINRRIFSGLPDGHIIDLPDGTTLTITQKIDPHHNPKLLTTILRRQEKEKPDVPKKAFGTIGKPLSNNDYANMNTEQLREALKVAGKFSLTQESDDVLRDRLRNS